MRVSARRPDGLDRFEGELLKLGRKTLARLSPVWVERAVRRHVDRVLVRQVKSRQSQDVPAGRDAVRPGASILEDEALGVSCTERGADHELQETRSL